MLLGRIILVLQAESHAILRKKWLTKIFVTGDILSFLLQGAGEFGSIMTPTSTDICHQEVESKPAEPYQA